MPKVTASWQVPGVLIRDTLAELGEASAADIHRRYRERLREENALRARKDRLTGRTYASTVRYVILLRAAGAIETVGTKPVDSRFAHLQRFGNGREAAVQVIYRLNLPTDAWQWVLPWQAAAGRVPETLPEVPGVPPPAAPMPTFALAEKPGRKNAELLISHLREIDPETDEGEAEFAHQAEALESWLEQAQELLDREEEKETPNEERLERLEEQRDAIEEAIAALQEGNFVGALAALDTAFPARAAPVPAPTVKPVAPPKIKAPPKAKAPPKPRLSLAERVEQEAAAFVPRILALREKPDLAEFDRLQDEMTSFFERVLDQIERGRTAQDRDIIERRARALETSAEAFSSARVALQRLPSARAKQQYIAALDLLLTCCPAVSPPSS